ncbi:hypothetical protein EXE49_07890 [Halorubrum sp. ASP121]|uniref:hypothetical protein n=1 Tax=Halorubrum sp. ASP121 TaxID=1855858 RepID=UPI0010F5C7B3|nr:hypothetical protein [Halorubrum sp. ASP121]TKX50083.1 hypothetical protein EXE49_07890 [Halorubrum sp. ASP121]
MTTTQLDDDRTFTRRGVMRKAAAVGVGSAATIGGASRMGGSPVGSAAAIAPLGVGAAAGAAALGYLINEGVDVFTGPDRDYSNYTGKNALESSIKEDFLEMKSVDERVMTSIENNLVNSENVAIAKGKAALVKALNQEKSKSEAKNKMDKSIRKYYLTIQENIVGHYRAQHFKVTEMYQTYLGHPEVDPVAQEFLVVWISGEYRDIYDEPFGLETEAVHGIDGQQLQRNGAFAEYPDPDSGSELELRFDLASPTKDGSVVPRFKADDIGYGFDRMKTAFAEVESKYNDVTTQLSGLADDLYNNYEAGDIPSEKVLDPVTAATELGNNTGLSIREAQAGMMGIPTSGSFSLRLELQNDSGEKYEVDAEIYTNAQPNDSDGNPAGFKVGNTYDPNNFEDPIYVSYEYVDTETGEKTSDFTQLVNPFTVLEATDPEGNSVEEVTPESKTAQSADVESIEKELESIREEQRRLLEQSQEPTGGAGAGFFTGSGPSTGVVAAVVGGIGVLYALTQGGTN